MKGFLLLFALLTLPAWALENTLPTAADHWQRLERMVDVGAISAEAAKQEQLRDQFKVKSDRRQIQRDLASVNPNLGPTDVKHLKIDPMVLFID